MSTIKQAHLEILSICMELTEKGYDSFYRYSGHVGFAEVSVYKGSWFAGSRAIYQRNQLYVSCDFKNNIELMKDAKECISKLKEILGGLE